jgi:hypothetical protein
MLVEQQMREDDAALLNSSTRRRSADQFVDSMKMQLMFGVMVRAMQFLKLADTTRLPVERSTLQNLLYKWGAFRHVGDGNCPACDAVAANKTEACVEEPPPLESKILRMQHVRLDLDKIEVCTCAVCVLACHIILICNAVTLHTLTICMHSCRKKASGIQICFGSRNLH